MSKDDLRLQVLSQARGLVADAQNLSPAQAEELLKLLDVLIEAIERNAGAEEADRQARPLAEGLIQNRNLVFTLKQQADELDALKKLSLNLTSSLDLQTVLDAVVTEAMRLVKNAHAAHIFLYENGKLQFGAALNDDGLRNTAFAMPRPQGLTYTVARQGQQVVVEDMQKHPLYASASGEWQGSIIGIPLKFNDTIVGVMNLSKTTRGGFSASELRLLGLLADQAAVAISNASLHQTVSRQAYSDMVTGLPNRRALDERLEEEVIKARRTGNTFAVIMLDVDGFKAVNDTHGHAIGDQVLRGMFNYLASGLRSTDFLARYGGDELTLILSQSDPPSAVVVVQKVLEKVSQYAFKVPSGEELHLGLSCGMAMFPVHANNAANLLRAADEALYRTKKQQPGSYMMARGFTGELRAE